MPGDAAGHRAFPGLAATLGSFRYCLNRATTLATFYSCFLPGKPLKLFPDALQGSPTQKRISQMTDATIARNVDETITAALLIIGDEILSGRTKDKNIGYIADHLSAIGIQLKEVRIVPDDEAEIVGAINALRSRYSYLFTTGGIGPTHDDITADCVAKAFGVEIDVDPRAYALMKAAYDKRGVEMTPARLRMARMPKGAEMVANAVSVAPGFKIGNVIVMAGIPSVMQVMLDAATPSLKTGKIMLSDTIELFRPEGEIGDMFGQHQKEHPDVLMGSYPFNREKGTARVFGTHLVLRSTSPERLAEAMSGLKAKLIAMGAIDD
jgi:molybdenum cofactor synthesis domain-containing protein